jgi:hypothetical protein
MFKIDPINFSHERSEPLAAYRDVGCNPSRPTIYSPIDSISCAILTAAGAAFTTNPIEFNPTLTQARLILVALSAFYSTTLKEKSTPLSIIGVL